MTIAFYRLRLQPIVNCAGKLVAPNDIRIMTMLFNSCQGGGVAMPMCPAY
jgi:hypothetical protein